MTRGKKRSLMKWVTFAAIAIVAAVKHNEIKNLVAQVPVLGDAVNKMS